MRVAEGLYLHKKVSASQTPRETAQVSRISFRYQPTPGSKVPTVLQSKKCYGQSTSEIRNNNRPGAAEWAYLGG